ncbi:MAG TPA: adenine deaminase [Methanomassiliicoccales archaeon]
MDVRSITGNFVDVVSGKIFPAKLSYADGKVLAIEKLDSAESRFILPGFIDAHIHIESSQLVPSRFAEAAVPHGTTATVSDPHEIANVMGMEGIQYMVSDSGSVPMRIFFTAPSCVPATPFETAGARIDTEQIERLLGMKQFVALGEVMNYMGAIREEPEVMGKIKAAHALWKPIDGHSPGLVGPDLVKYINAGIRTDHECLTADEAEEKFHLGMWVMVREGSTEKNMRDLMPFAKANECFLVSDDLRATDLMKGHVDLLLRKAISMGMDPIHAIRAVTAWPAWHYYLPGGVLSVGKPADFVIVDDLKDFKVREVHIAGELVAKDGKALFDVIPLKAPLAILKQDRKPVEFEIPTSGPSARVRVIRVIPEEIESRAETAFLKVIDDIVIPDASRGINLIAVVNRYREAPVSVAFVSGFDLKRGAMASTVAHDSHNIIAVGADPVSLAEVVNRVSEQGGYYITDGERNESMRLPVAGLMSTDPCHSVAEEEIRAVNMARSMGCNLAAPFMTLSFQALLVVPELKLSDKGLFDSHRMEFVDVVLDG